MYVKCQLQASAAFTPSIEYPLHRTLHLVKMFLRCTLPYEYYFGHLYVPFLQLQIYYCKSIIIPLSIK